MKPDQIAVSPCSNSRMSLDEALSAYSAMGYRYMELFSASIKSAVDCHRDPSTYLEKADRFGMHFASLHLPRIQPDHVEETLAESVAAARFAAALGVEVVLFKAKDRPTYTATARKFLDAAARLPLTVVIQNHFGTALTTLDDVLEVLDGVSDERLHTLLEVGHFHSAGVAWRDAVQVLNDTIALVHVKDQIGRQSVPFGKGEIDLRALFWALDERGYTGRYVVEMEVHDRENTLRYLAEAREFMLRYCEETP